MAKTRRRGKTRKKKQRTDMITKQKNDVVSEIDDQCCVELDSNLLDISLLASFVQKEPNVDIEDIKDFLEGRTTIRLSEFEAYKTEKKHPNFSVKVEADEVEIASVKSSDSDSTAFFPALDNNLDYDESEGGENEEKAFDAFEAEDMNIHRFRETNHSPPSTVPVFTAKTDPRSSTIETVGGTAKDAKAFNDLGKDAKGFRKSRSARNSKRFKQSEKREIITRRKFMEAKQNKIPGISLEEGISRVRSKRKSAKTDEKNKSLSNSPKQLQTDTNIYGRNNKSIKGDTASDESRVTRSNSKFEIEKTRSNANEDSCSSEYNDPTEEQYQQEALSPLISSDYNYQISEIEIAEAENNVDLGTGASSYTLQKQNKNKNFCPEFLESWKAKLQSFNQRKTNRQVGANLILKAKRSSSIVSQNKLKQRVNSYLSTTLTAAMLKNNHRMCNLRPNKKINSSRNTSQKQIQNGLITAPERSERENKGDNRNLSVPDIASTRPKREIRKPRLLEDFVDPTVSITPVVTTQKRLKEFKAQSQKSRHFNEFSSSSILGTELTVGEGKATTKTRESEMTHSETKLFSGRLSPQTISCSSDCTEPIFKHSEGILQIQTDPPSTELPPPMVYCASERLETGMFYLASQEGNRLQLMRFNGFTFEPYDWSNASKENVAEGCLFEGLQSPPKPESISVESSDIISETTDRIVHEVLPTPAVFVESTEATGKL